jgi:transposase InsO family protein
MGLGEGQILKRNQARVNPLIPVIFGPEYGEGDGLGPGQNSSRWAIVVSGQFAVTAPNRVWGSDITALWTQEGWLYIAIVVDLFSRKVVGWAYAASMVTPLITRALHMAVGQRKPALRLQHHSDRGSQ